MSEKVRVQVLGMEYDFRKGTPLHEIGSFFQDKFEHRIISARVNGNMKELTHKVVHDAEIEFLTIGDEDGNRAYRRTLYLVLCSAVDDLLGSRASNQLTIEHSVSRGLYCSLEGHEITDELLSRITIRMQEIAESAVPIVKEDISREEAIEFFRERGMNDKADAFYFRRDSEVHVYKLGDTADYYYGIMGPDTSYAKYFSLIRYSKGFVLQTAAPGEPEKIPEFRPYENIFNALEEATTWGREVLGVNTVADLNNSIADGKFESLVLVQEALQEKEIARIAQEIIAKKRRIVLIAGPSSSGKTTFSHRLSIQLRVSGVTPHPIPIDNYYLDRSLCPRDENGDYNFEIIEALDIPKFNQDMKDLLDGKEVLLPIFDFTRGKRSETGVPLKIGDSDVLVIEGIHALNDRLTEFIDSSSKYRIYISALTWLNMDRHSRIPTTDARLIRRICRDARTRGTPAAETIAMWGSVRRGEDTNIFPFQENCDATFNSSLVYEFSILKQYAEPLLFSVKPGTAQFNEARRLLKFLNYFLGVSGDKIPSNSIIREFTGGSCFNVG
ncbi:MAG: nucleoside kinase [Lachnospiraceae bacterium]|nr:nucleoside kinase [Lachnospiraceae bacterium]